MTTDRKRLREVCERGRVNTDDGHAFAEVVTPDVVLGLLDEVERLRREVDRQTLRADQNWDGQQDADKELAACHAVLSRLDQWTHEFGAALCQSGGYHDSHGDGIRNAKEQVSRILSTARKAGSRE